MSENFEKEIEKLRQATATSNDARVVAKLTAVDDAGVRKALMAKQKDGLVVRKVRSRWSLSSVGLIEVRISLQSQNDESSFEATQVLVMVDPAKRRVVRFEQLAPFADAACMRQPLALSAPHGRILFDKPESSSLDDFVEDRMRLKDRYLLISPQMDVPSVGAVATHKGTETATMDRTACGRSDDADRVDTDEHADNSPDMVVPMLDDTWR